MGAGSFVRRCAVRRFRASTSAGQAVFSGIIDQIGRVEAMKAAASGCGLAVSAPGYWQGVASGASIAVDGVCLTLTRAGGDVAEFDVIEETLRRTTLGGLASGSAVNLQKSLAVGERIDGHFVQGHVDAVARVSGVEQSERESIWWFEPGAGAMRYMVPKGSVAIDGISLTIAAVTESAFSVALIPTTLARTTIGGKGVGEMVNVETDILVRALVHRLEAMGIGEGRGSDEAAAFLAAQGMM